MAEDPNSSWGCSSWGQAHRRRHLETPSPDRSAPAEADKKDAADEPAPQAAVTTTQTELPVAATAGRKLPPPVIAATNRHKQLLGTSSSQPSKVSSDFPNSPTFRLSRLMDVLLFMF